MGIFSFLNRVVQARTSQEVGRQTEPIAQKYAQHWGIQKEYEQHKSEAQDRAAAVEKARLAHERKQAIYQAGYGKQSKQRFTSNAQAEMGYKASVKDNAHQRVLYHVRPTNTGMSIVAQREAESAARTRQRLFGQGGVV